MYLVKINFLVIFVKILKPSPLYHSHLRKKHSVRMRTNEDERRNERTPFGCRLSSLPLARQLNMKRKKAGVSGNCARVGFDLRRERTISDLAAEEESATYLLKQEFVVDWLRASQEQTNPPKSVLTRTPNPG
jgi:hypothetical protein